MAGEISMSWSSPTSSISPAEGDKHGPPAADISWMMLDRFVFRRDDDDGSFPDEAAAPMRASSSTSLGDRFTVALLVRAPPAVSRLYVQWPRDPLEPVDLEDKGTDLVTAHRNIILLRTTSRLMMDRIPYRQDYFVFEAGIGGGDSCLRRLPPCTQPSLLPSHGNKSKKTTMERMFDQDTIGLVRSSDEFAVVQLAKFFEVHPGRRQMGAELCVFRSRLSSSESIHEDTQGGEGKWEVLMLPIHHSQEEFSDLQGFSSDGAITFNNSICWVDYHHGGILSYTPTPLAAAQGVGQSFISYVRLPINNRPNNSLPKCLEMYRSLCVTGSRDNEQLKFVDVACKARAYVGPSFTITCHTFTPRNDHKWHKEVIVTSEKLWYINSRNRLVPEDSVTTFPLVSRDDPHLVHFLMSEPRNKINKVSVVVIDIITHKIISASTYIQGDEDLRGRDADMVMERSLLPRPFIPSQF